MRWIVLFGLVMAACTNKEEKLDNTNQSEAPKKSFSMIDTNHDGLISHQEWLVQETKAATIIPERNREQYMTYLERTFRRMDRDHDANVSFVEFSTNTSGERRTK